MEEEAEASSGGTCCICLAEGPKTLPLFAKIVDVNRTLSDVIRFVTNIQIKPGDDYYKEICSDCEHSLYKLEKFKRRFIENETKLRGIFQTTTLELQNDATTSIKDETCLKPYQCSICYLQYADIVDLQSHVFSNHERKGMNKIDIELFENGDKNENNIKTEVADSPEYTEDNYVESPFGGLPCEVDMKVDTEAYVLKTEKETYKCNLCNSYYKNQKSYRKHVREIHEKLVALPNAKIKDANGTITKLSKYEAKLINTTKFICKICSTYYKNQKSYRKHVRTKHEDGKPMPRPVRSTHECSHCNRQFLKKSKLIIHLRTHEAKGPHICDLCKREFTHKAHLDNHILSIHSTTDGHKCEVCEKSFPTIESLDIHRSSHSNQKKHQCPICLKSFHMLSTLKDHERVHTGERPYLCPTCGKGFTQNTNLQEHMRRHAGIKPFSCEICPRRFVAKGELAAHMRKHSGAHPFVCVDCGGRFTTSSSLVKHRRTHTGERPYACDLCNMRFAASGTLKNHRRTHTGEKPYKCTHCDKAFVQKNDLVSHTRCHTGERPYVCTTCGQAFRQSSALKTHLKMHPLLNQP